MEGIQEASPAKPKILSPNGITAIQGYDLTHSRDIRGDTIQATYQDAGPSDWEKSAVEYETTADAHGITRYLESEMINETLQQDGTKEQPAMQMSDLDQANAIRDENIQNAQNDYHVGDWEHGAAEMETATEASAVVEYMKNEELSQKGIAVMQGTILHQDEAIQDDNIQEAQRFVWSGMYESAATSYEIAFPANQAAKYMENEQTGTPQPNDAEKSKVINDWVDRGVTDVPLADLPQPQDVSGPYDFNHNISWENASATTKQLPEIQKEVNAGKTADEFSNEDQAAGLDYANGKRRIYDLYYGQDPVVLDKAGDEYVIISGRHRIFTAKELGLDTIPARVREKK